MYFVIELPPIEKTLSHQNVTKHIRNVKRLKKASWKAFCGDFNIKTVTNKVATYILGIWYIACAPNDRLLKKAI